MKTILILCFFSLSACLPLLAQVDNGPEPDLNGKDALQFQVASDFRLTSFDGTLLSFKHHTSKTRAWRVGVSLNGSYSKTKSHSEDTTGYYPTDETQKNGLISISLSQQRYVKLRKAVSLYYSIGAHFKWDNSDYGNNSTSAESFSGGPLASFGVEWFFSNGLSLSGEYSARGEYIYSMGKSDYLSRKSTTHIFRFYSDPVRLGLSAYF